MLDDIRTALRGLVRGRGLSAVLLISLGLGTGANVAVFGTVHSLLFGAPAGVASATDLLEIYTSRHDGSAYGPTSYDDFTSLRSADTPFESIAAVDDEENSVVSYGAAAQGLRVGAVSDEFFDVLKMQPLAGRALTAADRTTAPPGAVIGAAFWKALGQPGDILGGAIVVGERGHRVVGIAPDGFRGLRAGRPTDLWIPLRADEAGRSRGDRKLSLIARLRPGRTLDDARRTARGIALDLSERYPETNRGTAQNAAEPRWMTAVRYSPLDPATRRQTTIVAAVIVSAVVLLLVSACVNAGSLLVSRAVARRREIAVKMALGASRALLIRQLLSETLMISTAGAALGLLFAFWTLRIIPALFAPEQAALLDTQLDIRLVSITVATAAAAGATFGLVPALQGTTESPAFALRGDSGEISDRRGSSWIRGTLVICQLAVSVVLLIGTELLISSVAHALEGDLGFTARNIAVLRVPMQPTTANQDRMAAALRGLEEVEAVAWAAVPPLTRGASRTFRIEAPGDRGTVETVEIGVNIVSPRYFDTIRLPLIEGRAFDGRDHGRAEPVVIIDEILARRYFDDRAVGEVLISPDGERLEIVGVARSGRYRTLQESPFPTVYYPTSQEHLTRAYVMLRTRAAPAALLDTLMRRLARAGIAVEQASTLKARLAEALVLDRLVLTLVGACGLIALLMATLGVYGVINDAVRRRTREIGLRVALGAGRPQVIRLVMAEAVRFTAAGICVGVAAALSIAHFGGMLVQGLPGIDFRTFTAAPGILVAVVAAASIAPLLSALRVSPTIALRAE